MSMKKYYFNENINALEVDPRFIEDGLMFAQQNNHSSIRIYEMNERNNCVCDLDLSPFNECDFISKLYIHDNFKIGSASVNGLYGMRNLIELSFDDKKIKLDYSKLTQLETLYFKYHGSLNNLSSLTKLTDLFITSLKTENCSILEGLVSLKNIRISGTMATLSGIEKSQKLESITIFRSPKLHDISDIAKLPNLKKLHIESCTYLRDFSFLENNNSLEDLFITDLDSNAFVESMKKIKKVYFWNLKDGDMNPLLRSKSLERVSLSVDRKHYSHTQEEMNLILKSRLNK